MSSGDGCKNVVQRSLDGGRHGTHGHDEVESGEGLDGLSNRVVVFFTGGSRLDADLGQYVLVTARGALLSSCRAGITLIGGSGRSKVEWHWTGQPWSLPRLPLGDPSGSTQATHTTHRGSRHHHQALCDASSW